MSQKEKIELGRKLIHVLAPDGLRVETVFYEDDSDGHKKGEIRTFRVIPPSDSSMGLDPPKALEMDSSEDWKVSLENLCEYDKPIKQLAGGVTAEDDAVRQDPLVKLVEKKRTMEGIGGGFCVR